MGCMCMECKFMEVVRDNHEDLYTLCVCRESENFLEQISLVLDSCDFGKVDDYGEDEEMVGEREWIKKAD